MKSSTDTPGAETDRLIGDLVRVGVIESLDLATGKAVVRFGEQITPPIDWLMSVGEITIWIPPTVGQQVAVICPEGDADQGFIVGGLPSSAMAPLFLGLTAAIRFSNGAQVSYDPEAGLLDVQAVTNVRISAASGIDLVGPVNVTGDLNVSKTVTAETDVVGGGKSLKGHKHLGVTTGGGVSGAPQ